MQQHSVFGLDSGFGLESGLMLGRLIGHGVYGVAVKFAVRCCGPC